MSLELRAVLFALAVFAAPAPALAVDCDVPNDVKLPVGYLTGADLAAMSDEALDGYLFGFLNGFIFSVIFGAERECIEQAHKCIAYLQGSVVIDRIRKYIEEDPRRLESSAAQLGFLAMFRGCVHVAPPRLPS